MVPIFYGGASTVLGGACWVEPKVVRYLGTVVPVLVLTYV